MLVRPPNAIDVPWFRIKDRLVDKMVKEFFCRRCATLNFRKKFFSLNTYISKMDVMTTTVSSTSGMMINNAYVFLRLARLNEIAAIKIPLPRCDRISFDGYVYVDQYEKRIKIVRLEEEKCGRDFLEKFENERFMSSVFVEVERGPGIRPEDYEAVRGPLLGPEYNHICKAVESNHIEDFIADSLVRMLAKYDARSGTYKEGTWLLIMLPEGDHFCRHFTDAAWDYIMQKVKKKHIHLVRHANQTFERIYVIAHEMVGKMFLCK